MGVLGPGSEEVGQQVKERPSPQLVTHPQPRLPSSDKKLQPAGPQVAPALLTPMPRMLCPGCSTWLSAASSRDHRERQPL